MLKKIVFGLLISNFLLFACKPMKSLQTNLGELKSSLSELKTKLGTLNTKLSGLKGKLEAKGQPLASEKFSMNLQELVENIKKYNEAVVNLGDAQKMSLLAKNIPMYEAELKEIKSKIPDNTTSELELTGDAADINAIHVDTLTSNIEFIQKYFTGLKILKLKNFNFKNSLVYAINFKDLDLLEIENIKNLCALEILSKVKSLKIFQCDQLGDQSVAEGNAKARVGIRMDKKIGVEQISIIGCTKLGEIHLDNFDSLVTLDLLGCSGLKTVFIRDCSTIKNMDFTGCLSLQSLRIWSNCNQLQKIKIPADIKTKIKFELSHKSVESKIEYVD